MSGIEDTLVQSGVIGAVLAWFMLRMEKVVKENSEIISGLKEMVRDLNAIGAEARREHQEIIQVLRRISGELDER
jgi:hypothetical protein